MNNEKLNKLLPYCGHGLKYHGMGSNDWDGNPAIISFSGMELQDEEICFRGEENCEDGEIVYHDVEGEVFPILFPLDCLTGIIETKHGTEIPIVKLAEICFNGDEDLDNSSWFKNGAAYYLSFGFRHRDEFVFDSSGCSFRINRCDRDDYSNVNNQWKLFQYLYSRHIAFNLSPDEYIPVTDEFNPYKLN